MAVTSRVQAEPLRPAAELDAFLAGRVDDGAVVNFTGVTRRSSHSGAEVAKLHLEHYPGMTERSIADIAEAGAARFEVSDVLVIHRHGEIAPGEAIVFVAVASRRRGEAFAAAEYLMDHRLKPKRPSGNGRTDPATPAGSNPRRPTATRRARWSD